MYNYSIGLVHNTYQYSLILRNTLFFLELVIIC